LPNDLYCFWSWSNVSYIQKLTCCLKSLRKSEQHKDGWNFDNRSEFRLIFA
jgi:hypothetical protein